MRKLYTCLVLLSTVFTLVASKGNAQVNYVFSTSQNAYQPLVAATRLSMSNPTPTGYYEEDEGFVNNVPIGFNFVFNNQPYSNLNINANGYVTFGAPFTIDVNLRYNANSLTRGPVNAPGILGIIAPLWDDLRLQDTFGLKCKTEGAAPNRTFTVEWKDISWNYNSLDTAISFQMKLYETSNAIEFTYQQGSGKLANANASIGIATCTQCTSSYLSVGADGNITSVSSVKEFDEINAKPSTGTVYHFEPGGCSTTTALNLGNYNSRSASFSWNGNSGNYDYAISTSPLQPITFSTTSSNSVTVNSLQPGTIYYMNVRSSCNSTAKSGWATYTFKTPCEATLPYKENFEANNKQLPACIITENPTGGNPWQLAALSQLPPYNNAIKVFGNNAQASDAWFVLPAANLEGGKSYRIKFKYKVGDSAGLNQKIEIKIGTILNGTFAGWSTIYKNTKLSELNFKDTSLLFAPPANNIYFLAFRCNSDKNPSSLFIDDIELSFLKPMPVKLVTFTGDRVGERNLLSWRTSAEQKNKHFELQKGIDGVNFTSIKTVVSKGVNGNSTVNLDYTVTDSTPFIGTTYYRLRVVDTDENEYFTQTVAVKSPLPQAITFNKVYPNPARDVMTAVITSPYNARGFYIVSDAYGKVLMNVPVALIKGDNLIKIDVSSLNRGVYMGRFTCTLGGDTDGKSFIKQ